MDTKDMENRSYSYEHFFSLALDLLCIADDTGHFVLLNKEWERTLGYPLNDLLGRPFMDFVHQEDLEKTEEALKSLAVGQEVLSFVNRYRCRDGTFRWLEWRSFPEQGFIYAAARDITRHISSRQELERFRDVMNNSLNEIYIVDADSLLFTFVSAGAQKNLGYSEEELTSMTPYEINSPRQKRVLENHFKDLRKGTGKKILFLTDHYRKDGSHYPAEVHLQYLKGEGSSYYLGIVMDITEKYKWERALEESEERYRRLAENADDIIYRIELFPEKRFTFINKAVERVTGYTPREHYDDPDLGNKLVHPEDRSLVEEGWKEKSFFNRPVRLRWITKAGKVIWTEQHNVPLYDNKGRLTAIEGIARDITERMEMVQRLNNEKKRFEVTLYSIGDAVIATDTRGKVTLMNPVAEQILGIESKEAEGLPLDDIFFTVDEEKREPLENPATLILGKGEKSVDYPASLLIGKEGRETLIETSAFPIMTEKDDPAGIVVVFRDISEKRASQDHLIRSQRLESLGLLAGRIAHDFNNLLGGLFGYIDIARQHFLEKDSERGIEYLDKARSIYERIRSLTGRFLTFSKGGSPVRKRGDLRPVIRKAMEMALTGSKVSAKAELDESLWTAEFDEGQMSQVFINLFNNALQSMKEEGRLYIRAYNLDTGLSPAPSLPAGPYIIVEVEDDGEGIPAQYLKKVFDPFFTTRKTGSGLGLTSSDSIVKRHGGAITVRSTLGEGSLFTIFLPASGGVKSLLSEGEGQLFRGEGRALVLDDEPSIREVTGEMLRRLGFSVDEAKEGAQALKKIASAAQTGSPYTLVIADLTIPAGKSGKDIIGDIRKIHPGISVIVSTGYSEDPILNDPQKYGFTAGLFKPFTLEELSRVLSSLRGEKE